MNSWAKDAIFYHIYPLGLCGAPEHNDFNCPPEERLNKLYPWVDHIAGLGANAVYLGPLFESSTHGYNTADYYRVDRRLGTNETLKALAQTFHARGIRVVLDGVFNHVGRDFWAFKDVQARRENSPYASWFTNLRFGGQSPYGDPFTYEGWDGHYSLVKLNLENPHVRAHLLDAVRMWIREFDIDGLRLDAADVVSLDFLRELGQVCREVKPDFWLMGEIVFGDYRRWTNEGGLDSATNYEAYKSLYSSFNEHNMFEIAYALNRQFGEGGIYRGLGLYSFADNHDVNRIASTLKDAAHLYPLHILLFSMPGIPSIYYGSEFGLEGKKTRGSDAPIRPSLDLNTLNASAPQPGLPGDIRRLAALRNEHPALRHGDYRQLHVSANQLAFVRQTAEECLLVAINASDQPAELSLNIPAAAQSAAFDILNHQPVTGQYGQFTLQLPARWGQIIKI
ncbi:MAG TPA: alpha-amylase family glycosyl hydrolase [Anaerolineaceae bacterium]|nr:alpha-amylase family glycosyl hydrolase [Anaerolineaceae bacterium]